MVASAGVTLYLETIRQAWELILESGAGIGLVLILRWYWWRVNAWSEVTAMVAPVVGHLALSRFTTIVFPESLLYLVVWTSVCWVAVTLLTPAEPDEVLAAFYTKVRPGGPGWRPVAARLGLPPPATVRGQLLEWIAWIGLVYGTLLGIGALLLPTGNSALSALSIALTAAIFLCRRERKGP